MKRVIGTTQFSPSWSVRKLLICFTILNSPRKTEFTISDFIFPVRYPRSIRTDMWEVVQAYQCLHQLRKEGISVAKEWLDPLYFVFTSQEEKSEKEVNRNLKQLRSTHFEGYWKEKQLIPKEVAQYYVIPRFLNFKLKIKRSTLNKKVRAACKDFFEPSFSKHQHYFGKPFCKQVFDRFFHMMCYRQGAYFQFNFGVMAEEDHAISDEFVDILFKDFPYEFNLWQKGIYEFPFFWYLIHGHLNQRFVFHKLSARVDDLGQFEKGSFALDWLGFDRIPLMTSLLLSLPKKDTTDLPDGEPITSVEIVPSGDHLQFVVYVNQQYHKPILLSRSNESGKLIYTIANKGYAPIAEFRKAFDYIRRDRRFKLFSQSKALFTQILELDGDGMIVPARGVRFGVFEG